MQYAALDVTHMHMLSVGNAVAGGAGGNGGNNNGNNANGGSDNSGDFSGNGGIAVGNNGNGGAGGNAIGGEVSTVQGYFIFCSLHYATPICLQYMNMQY